VSLCVSYIYLTWNINKHFARELKDEGTRIKTIFVVFSLAYVSRAIVFLLSTFGTTDHPFVVYYIMYFFWEVLPLCLIMWHHLQAFRAEKKER